MLVGGLALYALACIACALAPTIGFLIGARFVQAIGCCAAVVVARAVIRDVFDAQAGAHVLARASSILAIGPLFGPILGSVLEVRFGYRATFVVVATIAAALLAATLRRLPETNLHLDPRATRPRALVMNYVTVLRSPAFRAHTLAGAATYGGLFAFIAGSPFVLTQVLGVADRVVRPLLRLLRVGLPARDHRLPPPPRCAEPRADDAARGRRSRSARASR